MKTNRKQGRDGVLLFVGIAWHPFKIQIARFMAHNISKELIVLVGPMGAGKTTIGKLLAKETGFEFCDSDKVIEERSGANIPWIFDVEGEEGFRVRETNAIAELSQKKRAILATGGGAMMRSENRDYVTRTGFVVYLNTSVEQQYKRTHKDKNRPLLQGDDALNVLKELYQKRDPLYREVADMVVDTDKKSLKAIVKSILLTLEQD